MIFLILTKNEDFQKKLKLNIFQMLAKKEDFSKLNIFEKNEDF